MAPSAATAFGVHLWQAPFAGGAIDNVPTCCCAGGATALFLLVKSSCRRVLNLYSALFPLQAWEPTLPLIVTQASVRI